MRGARIPALSVFHNLRGPLQPAHFADAGHVFAVPFDFEFEILVGIDAMRINGEMAHGLVL
jgi:hypothetical protein